MNSSNILEMIVRLKDEVSAGLDGIKDKAAGMSEKIGKSMVSAGTTLTKGLTAPIVGIGVAGLKAATDVDKGLREVNTLFGLTGDAAEENFQKMKGEVAGLSTELGIAQDTLVNGLYSAISAGVPADNAIDFMAIASKASVAGVTDVETAVDGLTTTINAFGLEQSEAQAVSDSMFAAVQGGKTTFEELSGALFNIAPSAAAAGVSFAEVNAGIATLTAGGTPTSVATTQMRAALVGLQKPSEALDKIFQDLGYSSAAQALEQEGLAFSLGAVADAAQGDAGELQKLLGSTEAVSAAQVIAGTGAEKMAAEMDRQAQAAGATETAFQEMNKSASRDFEKLKVGLVNLGIVFGEMLLPVVQKAVQVFTGLTEKFQSMSPEGQKIVGIVLAVVAAIGPLLLIGGKLLIALPKLVQGFKLVQAGFAALKVAFAANPFILIAIAVVALAVLIYKNWDEIKAFLLAAWEWIKATAETVWTAVSEFFSGIWDTISSTILDAWNAVSEFLTAAWDTLKEAVETVWNLILDFLTTWWNSSLPGLIYNNWDAIKEWLSAAWDTLKGAIEAAWQAILDFLTTWWNHSLPGMIYNNWDAIKNWLATAWSNLKAAVATAFAAIRDVIVGIFTAIRDAVMGIVLWLYEGLKNSFTNMKAMAVRVWNLLKDAIIEAWTIMQRWITAGVDTITGIFDGLKSAVESVWKKFGQMKDNVIGYLRGMANGVIDQVKRALEWIKKLNPFAKSSPSLVENVQAGTKIIGEQYLGLAGRLRGIQRPDLSPAPFTISAGQERAGAVRNPNASDPLEVTMRRLLEVLEALMESIGANTAALATPAPAIIDLDRVRYGLKRLERGNT